MRRALLVLVLAGCSAAAPAAAPRATRRTAPPARSPAPERRYGTVELAVHDAPLLSVLDAVAAAADRPIAASVSSTTRTSLTVHEAPWRDVLDYLVAEHHLNRRDVGRTIVLEEPPRNRLEACGAHPTEWFLLLARQGRMSIILPGNLHGEVDASLANVRYEDALRATAATNGLEVEPVR